LRERKKSLYLDIDEKKRDRNWSSVSQERREKNRRCPCWRKGGGGRRKLTCAYSTEEKRRKAADSRPSDQSKAAGRKVIPSIATILGEKEERRKKGKE